MKKHIHLIVGIGLPIIFIGVVMLAAFLPNLSVNPQYDFIYSIPVNNDYYGVIYQNYYQIIDGKITKQPSNFERRDQYDKREVQGTPPLYRYSAKNNTIHSISFEEAEALNLDPGPSSPDGYNVEYRYGHDGIFEIFGSDNSDNGYYITKGNGSKKLPNFSVDNNRGYYYNDSSYRVIGWIK